MQQKPEKAPVKGDNGADAINFNPHKKIMKKTKKGGTKFNPKIAKVSTFPTKKKAVKGQGTPMNPIAQKKFNKAMAHSKKFSK